MKKIFPVIQLGVVLLFVVWLFLRNRIWENTALLPAEMIQIYLRDGSTYFLLLRTAFLAAGIAGISMFWQSRWQWMYLLLPFLWYPALLALDSLLMYAAMNEIRAFNEELAPLIPWGYYRALGEAMGTVVFGGICLLFLYISTRRFSATDAQHVSIS